MEALRRWFSHHILCIKPKTLKQQEQEQEQEQQSFDIPTEVMTDDILSRLPVKSIIRFRSVSKPWLSRISDPSFINLQLTHATTAFFFPAFDVTTRKLLMFSGNYRDGSLTHLMTLDRVTCSYNIIAESEHLNGLVLLTVKNPFNYYEAIVVNPSTRKRIKIGYGPYNTLEHIKYFFGFNESTNEHTILKMGGRVGSTPTLEIIGLSKSKYSWRKRKIDASFDNIGRNIRSCDIQNSVCVNNVIHMMLQRTGEILAFDLRTNMFSIVKVPLDDMARMNSYVSYPYLMKINGCIGVACDYLVAYLVIIVVHIWILKDYENHVWVKETITIHQSWKVLGSPMLLDSVSMDEFILSVLRKFDNVVSVPIYNIKNRSFRFVKFTLDRPKLFPQDLCFRTVKCYLESITPLLVT